MNNKFTPNKQNSVVQQNVSSKSSPSLFIDALTAENSQFETFEIEDVSKLKKASVYYFLKEHNISEHHITNLRKAVGAIKINGTNATTRSAINDGDTLQILASAQTPTQTNLCDGKLEILYEDADYLIVNKPHGLATTPTRSHFSMNLGGQICKYMLQKDGAFVLRILNRLDKDTAGIVVVAKNVFAYNALSNEQKDFSNEQNASTNRQNSISSPHKIEKEYFAIASGNIYENITINAPIHTVSSNGINQMKRIVSPLGKRAVTHLSVIGNHLPRSNKMQENFQNLQTKSCCQEEPSSQLSAQLDAPFCLVKLTLETGRTHQIRVHLSSIGHALLGDKIYSTSTQFPTLEHAMLILKSISFTHFRTQQKIKLEVPFPNEWNEFLMKLDNQN